MLDKLKEEAPALLAQTPLIFFILSIKPEAPRGVAVVCICTVLKAEEKSIHEIL